MNIRVFALTLIFPSITFAGESIRMPQWSEPPRAAPNNGAGAAQGTTPGSTGSTPTKPTPKEESDSLGHLTDATSEVFGEASSRAAAVIYKAGGTSVLRDGEYEALGGALEFHTGNYGGKPSSAVYLGYEARASLGYQQGPDYKTKLQGEEEPEGKLTLLGEIGPAIIPVHWGGSIAGRLALLPAAGLIYNGARYYESYAYLALSGRLQVFVSETIMLQAQYGYVPWTAKQSFTIREHRAEAALHISEYAFGARYQVDMITSADGSKDASSPTIGGFAALLF